MKRTGLAFGALSSSVIYLAACGASDSAYSGRPGGGMPAPPPASGSTGQGNGAQVGAGLLTAGDFDDNLNFDFFQEYLTSSNHTTRTAYGNLDRTVITVRDSSGAAVSGARVEISDGTGVFLDAPTGSDGKTLFFPDRDGAPDGQVDVRVTGPNGTSAEKRFDTTSGDRGWSLSLDETFAAPQGLDLAFIVDATGSMSDELEYLKAELQAMVEKVQREQLSVRIAVIVYRDHGDEYVVRSFDFTNDVQKVHDDLAQQSAGGGGDVPEAMDDALAASAQLQWRSGNIARVAFLIADAPTHSERESIFFDAVDQARAQGVRIYPVAASGVFDEAEYLLRIAAQATLGRYLFLTDDSGIGNTHEEPHIPCYRVQMLGALMTRMIETELTGTRVEPDPSEILRSVGDPKDGRCTLQGGRELRY